MLRKLGGSSGIYEETRQKEIRDRGGRMIDFKPCPFCGYDRMMMRYVGHFVKPWVVECGRCSASGSYAYDEKEAIELWNKRVKE